MHRGWALDSEKKKCTGFPLLAEQSLSMMNRLKAMHSLVRNLKATAMTISRLYTS